MAEHHELVAEMATLEQMGTQERQKLAKKRRLQQLKKWAQREKEWIAKEKQLNKWLANMLNEDNNGLNLKQYTTYSSSGRSKKKKQLQLSAQSTGSGNSSNNKNGQTNGQGANNSNEVDLLNNNNISICSDSGDVKATRFTSNSSGPKSELNSLTPNGRIHFNVGVMLLEAAARNDYDEVKRLLMLGVSPDSVNHDGLTALHQCCIDASEPMMRLLLEFDANIDARDTEQWTPLHAACTCGHLNLVKILVENGANLLAVNGDGNMPFDTCEDEATLDYIETQMVKQGITQEMIDLTRASTEMQMISDLEKQVADGKDLNSSDKNGVTQLHIAAANGYISVIKFLLKHGVNVNACDNDQWRPIHGAACWGNEQHCKIVELLVEAGADLNAKTLNDETVFDLCDNAELLEKLNQLKDELESKQASGSDRLRRTQSRTNSRVHSVRRTSVRDKNQISRREAREEALLRVENSPVSNGQKATTGAGATGPQEPTRMGSTNNLDASENNNSSKASEKNPLPSQSTNKDSNNDQVDGLVTNGYHQPPVELESCKQTDLDDQLNSNDVDSDEHDKLNSNHGRSQSSSAHTSNDSIAAKRRLMIKQRNVAECSENLNEFLNNAASQNLAMSNPKLKVATSIGAASLPSAEATATKSLSIGQSSHKTKVNIVSNSMAKATVASDYQRLDIDGFQNHLNHTHNAIQTHHNQPQQQRQHGSNNDIACDSSQQQQQLKMQAQQQQAALLVPINYTLSNLKKQRSDLRMRSTIIGAQTTNGSSAPVVVASTAETTSSSNKASIKKLATAAMAANSTGHQQQRQVVCVDPQPTATAATTAGHQMETAASNGGQGLPESPGLTFKKFRGEPSEVIGGRERNNRRKWCCVLI